METVNKYIIGIDLGKQFGYSFWENGVLIESGSVETKDIAKPYELDALIRKYIRNYLTGAGNIEVVLETGQGYMSKNAWRGFGVQEWVVEKLCKDFVIPLHGYHINWLKNYNRRLEKTDENDAIELVEYHLKKQEKLNIEIKL